MSYVKMDAQGARSHTMVMLLAAMLTLYAGAASAGEPVQGTIPATWSTGQKPQSKLWHDQGTWWAALPQAKGVWLWRFADGKFAPQDTPGALKGTAPNSECDVVLAGKTLFVLAVQPQAAESPLYAFELKDGAYRTLPNYPVMLKHGPKVVAVVCDVDSTGTLWAAWRNAAPDIVAAAFNPADPASGFAKPVVLAAGVGPGDIAAVAAFKGHVGVFWSFQKQQKFVFRARTDGQPADKWDPEEVVAEGKGIANDHINLAADADGNLWAVTKAQTGINLSVVPLNLYRRNAQGQWDKKYALFTPGQARTRPIVALDAEKPIAYVMYSDKAKVTAVYLRKVSLTDGKPGEEIKALTADYNLNNATGCKAMVSERTGLMVLAGADDAKNGPAHFRLFELKDVR